MKKFIQILLSILSIVGIVYVLGQEFEIPDTNVPSLEEQINKAKLAASGIPPACESSNDWAEGMKRIKKKLAWLSAQFPIHPYVRSSRSREYFQKKY